MGMQWTVGRKLAAGFAVPLLMLLIVGGVSYRNMNQLVENAGWVTHTHKVLEELEGVVSLMKDAETGQRGYLLTCQKRYLEPYDAAVTKYPDRLRELRRLTQDNPAQQRRIDALESLLAQKVEELRETIALRARDDSKDSLGPQRGPGLQAALQLVQTDRGKKLMDEIRSLTLEMQREEKDLLDRRMRDQEESVRSTRIVIIGGSLLAFAIIAVIGTVITRSITRPLAQVMGMAQQIAAGDLKQDPLAVDSGDEIGRLGEASNSMLKSLQDLTGRISTVTASLNSSVAEIMASTQQQAAGTREQAATVQEITTTMEEISQSGVQISGKAKQVAAAAEATSAASNSGIQAVQETTRTMTDIREQVEEVAEHIVALSEKTQAVGEIIATVNDLAERSNLLALNAAIEAAAAGEQGNRFSVVAGEMKNLADQAKESTVQVRTILGEIQKGINSSVMLTEEAVKRVEAGKQRAEVAEQTIRQMARTTLDSVQAFEQIIGAGNQQQIGFEQVAQGMKDIRQASTQTAAATAQLEIAVANLNALSRELKEAVGRYKL